MANAPLQTQVLARVRAAYEALEATRDLFTKNEVFERALEACKDLKGSALEALVASMVEKADREAVSKRNAKIGQRQLFQMEGSFALGENQRIAKRAARREHLLQVLQLSDENRERVDQANDELHEDFGKIDPYFGPGVSMDEAVEAYKADNPNAEGDEGYSEAGE